MKHVWLIILSLIIVAAVTAGIFFLRGRKDLESARDAGDAPKPNIVLIVVEAFRTDRLGGSRNGEPLTPFLDEIAAEAAVFTRAVTPCTWTRPAMASLYTSLHVDAHQVYHDNDPEHMEAPTADALSNQLENIATFLKAAGYRTLGVQTNGNLVPQFGFAHGFDEYEYHPDAPGHVVTTAAKNTTARARQPFFLYAHYFDPHIAYAPPDPYLAMMGWPPGDISPEEKAIAEDFMGYFWEHCNVVSGRAEGFSTPELSEAGREAVRLRYDAEIRYADGQLRVLVTHLREQAPGTIFVITADHGEHFWDHGYLGHGLTMYECELHVPLFILGPGIEPGVRDAPVSLLDIMPTVAALLGRPASPMWQGRDMLDPAIPADRQLFSYTRGPWPGWNADREMVQAGPMKLIRDLVTGRLELYDWQADPREQHDLAGERPELAAELAERLDAHREENIGARQTEPERAEIDEETQRQLEAMGYIK